MRSRIITLLTIVLLIGVAIYTFRGLWAWNPEVEAAVAAAAHQATSTLRPTPTPPPAKTQEPPAPNTSRLTAHDEPYEEAIAELESLGLIPMGGGRVFRENYAYFTGTGNWFTPLARQNPFTHVIMAGELTFDIGTTDEFEICVLTTRINTNAAGQAVTYTDVGLTNGGDVLVADRADEEDELNALELVPLGLSLGDPHHLLYTVLEDSLTVYVDGRKVIEDVEVVERSGTYGISLLGRGPNARCEGRNIWVHQVDNVIDYVGADECFARANNNVNLRTGPGTAFAQVGTLAAGETVTITGQSTGDEGFVWWQLETEDWVRSDVITEVGNCAAVDQVTP